MANNTGVFFNINDNDGIPLVGVSTDGRVLINHLYGNCLIGSTSSTGTAAQPLQVSGGAYVSGNTGIGTTNPKAKLDVNGSLNVSGVSTISVNSSSDALRITQTGTGNALVVEDSANPDSTPFVIGADGSIGIGTNNTNGHKLSLYNSSLQISNSTEGSGTFSGLTFSYEPVLDGHYIISWFKPLNIVSGSSDLIISSNRVGIGSTQPTAKLDVLGDVNISGILTASKVASGIPQNTKTSAYVLQKSDVGKYISISSGGVTVPSGVFSEGDVISIYNNSFNDQTITQGTSVTMYFSGTSITGNRTISQRGLVTILCVGSNTFIIGGAGLS